MSVLLTQPVDIAAEAARGRRATEQLALVDMPRLAEALHATADPQSTLGVDIGLFESANADGSTSVRLKARIDGVLLQRCSLCLGPVSAPVAETLELRSGPLPDGDFELTDERVRLADIIEDELLLIVDDGCQHASVDECTPETREFLVSDKAGDTGMRTPLAGLRALLDEAK